MAISGDVFFATISELSAKLRAKEFSAVELTRAFCDRLERIGPQYNALALSLRREALRKARDVDDDLKRQRTRRFEIVALNRLLYLLVKGRHIARQVGLRLAKRQST